MGWDKEKAEDGEEKPVKVVGKAKPLKSEKKKLGRMLRVDKAKRIRKEKADAKRERQAGREKERKELGDAAPPKEIPRTIENTRETDVTMITEEDEEGVGDAAPPKEIPRTIENTRETDVTMITEEDEEVAHEEAHDEMASYFNRETKPKVLITMSPWAKTQTWKLCFEINKCIPDSKVFARKGIPFKKIVKQARREEYTDIIVIHEDNKKPNAFVLCHLPEGPTAYFKINNLTFTKDIKAKTGESTSHAPELILNNFDTRLGHTIGRMFAALFPHNPQFRGRRVVTLHNQRDYVFFRHHRYEFKREGKKAALLELGPRFTLRLKSLQKGTFDSKFGEAEWTLKRHEMETTRRRFFL